MRWGSLVAVLRSRAHARGLDLVVEVIPWPDRGSVQRVGRIIYVTIDSRQSLSDRLHALAHEAGHILFGHYRTEEEGVWTLRPTDEGPDDPWEAEAEYFAMFVGRSKKMPAEWIIGDQLGLL